MDGNSAACRLRRIALAVLAVSGLGLAPGSAQAIGAAVLQEVLQTADKPVVIDIRDAQAYQAGHIPGAIHIPAQAIGKRKLPPFGRVVVYGDGINTATTAAVLASLAAYPGISAEALEGGFPAWQSASSLSTGKSGLSDEFIRHLTYQQVLRLQDEHASLAIVDLRRPTRSSGTDLELLYPGREIIRPGSSGWDRYARSRGKVAELLHMRLIGPEQLYILIDDGEGRIAESVARRLFGKGVRNVAILTGGDIAIQSGGEARTVTRTHDAQ